MTSGTPTLEALSINTIRTLSMDAVQAANSGHPGAPMGLAPVAYALWMNVLKHNPAFPDWPDRDRFVLSAGHASMLLYSMLHLTGYDLPLDELRNFRQLNSKTPGHPEYGRTAGVEATTGPLGSGFAAGVGMAMAEAHLAARYNKPGHSIVDHHTYAIVSDGDLMEGVTSEAASLAGTLKLGKLIYVYDDNKISIEGSTDLAFTEDVAARFKAYGWHVQSVDGEDVQAVTEALRTAKAEAEASSLIIAHTTIGFGSPNKAGTAGAHGAPLGSDEVALTRQELGWPTDEPFRVPDEVAIHMRAARAEGAAAVAEWHGRLNEYRKAYPAEAAELDAMSKGTLSPGWDACLPMFEGDAGKMATRAASGKTLQALAAALPGLLGGSADLAPSNNTNLDGLGDFNTENRTGRNLHFGVREHAMGAIANGLALHGGIVPFVGTFLVFADYMRGAMRLAAIMGLNVTYVMTHDSIGVGEDGPTHQPTEQIASFRAMPGMRVIRPADANETVAAWKAALTNDGPTILALTRQSVPLVTDAATAATGTPRGAYIVHKEDSGEPDIILIGTGSEVALASAASELLNARDVTSRVVSMPSWELFEDQDADYQKSVLPSSSTVRLSIEAATTFGWGRYVGGNGDSIGIDRFGLSAPGGTVYEEFGLTAEAVAERAEALVRGG